MINTKDRVVFVDDTGKRRIVINVLASLFFVTFVTLVILSIFIFFKLDNINTIATKGAVDIATTGPDKSIILTLSNENVLPVLNDQISNLSTIIVPKYTLDDNGINQAKNFPDTHADLNSTSLNKPVSFKKYQLISTQNYDKQPAERVHVAAADLAITEIVTGKTIESLTARLIEDGYSGVYIDFDLAIVSDTSQEQAYVKWLEDIKLVLSAEGLELGLLGTPTELNEHSEALLSVADRVYIDLDLLETNLVNLNIIKTYSNIFNKQTSFTIPTISRVINTGEFTASVIDVPYKESVSGLGNQLFIDRTIEPITFSEGKLTYHATDAITAYNYLHELTKLLGYAPVVAITDPGFEEYTLWQLLSENVTAESAEYVLSTKVAASLEVNIVGRGDIYSIQSQSKPGTRRLTFEEGSISESQLLMPAQAATVNIQGNNNKKVALTFDDGPHPVFTRQVLDVLDQYGVKGTFFVVGKNALKHPEIVQEIVARGHEVENHSYDHPKFSQLTAQSQKDQIQATSDLLLELTGQKISYFRKPFSDSTTIDSREDLQYLQTLKDLGLKASEYDIDSKDWKLATADLVIDRTIQSIKNANGNFNQILLHDAHQDTQRTVAALPAIIEYLKLEGVQMVRLDELDSGHSTPGHAAASVVAVNFRDTFYNSLVIINIAVIVLSGFKYGLIGTGVIFYWTKKTFINLFIKTKVRVPSRQLSLAIVIACYNEEKVIAKTIDALLASTYTRFKIIAINDGSKDGTLKILNSYARKDKRVTVLDLPNGGKARALQTAIRRITNRWIVFCDADTLFRSDVLGKFADTIENGGNVSAVAGQIHVGNPVNNVTRSQVLEYGVAHKFIKTAQDPGNMITVVPGASGLWNRHALNSVGGFSEQTLAEDADTTISLIGDGHKVRYRSDIIAKTEAPESLRMLYVQRTRWQLGNMQAVAKHWRGFFNPQYGMLGWIGLPLFMLEIISAVLFPILLTFTAINLATTYLHITSTILPSARTFDVHELTAIGLVLVGLEVSFSLIVIFSEKRTLKSYFGLLGTLPYYLTVYKGFLSYTALVALTRALRGTPHGWGSIKRTATVNLKDATNAGII